MPLDITPQTPLNGDNSILEEAKNIAKASSLGEAKAVDASFVPAPISSKRITQTELEEAAKYEVPTKELLGTYNNTNSVLAKYQGGGTQAARAVYGGVGKGALGFLEGLGYAADIPGWFAALQDADNTFADRDNWLSKAMKSGKESIDEAAPIYRRDPNASFDFGDSGYWAQMSQGIIESATQFVALGAGVGSLVGRTVGGLARMGALGGLDEAIVSQIGTAVVTNMVEGKMMALDTQKKVYEEAIAKGMSEEDAQKISLKAGNEVVWKNKINIVGDAIQLKALFGGPKAYSKVADIARKEATKNASKSLLKKVGDFAMSNMANEGLEENVGDLVVASAEENALATIEGRKAKGLIDLSLDYFSTATAYETFAVGAISGGLMGGGIEGVSKLTSKKPMNKEDDPQAPKFLHNPDLKHPGEFKESDPFADFKDEEFKPKGVLQGDRRNATEDLSKDEIDRLNEEDIQSQRAAYEKGREARKKAWKEEQGIYDEAPADGNPEALAKHEEWKKKRQEQVLAENQSYEEALKAFNENQKLKEADMAAQAKYEKDVAEYERQHGISKSATEKRLDEVLTKSEKLAKDKATAIAEGNIEYAEQLDEFGFSNLAIEAYQKGTGDSFKEIVESYANSEVDLADPNAAEKKEMKKRASELLPSLDKLEENYNKNVAKHGAKKGAMVTQVQNLANITGKYVDKYGAKMSAAENALNAQLNSMGAKSQALQIQIKGIQATVSELGKAEAEIKKSLVNLDPDITEALTKKKDALINNLNAQLTSLNEAIHLENKIGEDYEETLKKAGIKDTLTEYELPAVELEELVSASRQKAHAILTNMMYQAKFEELSNPSSQSKKSKAIYDKVISFVNNTLSKETLKNTMVMVLENPTLSKKHKEDLVKAITTRSSLIDLGITNAIVEQDRKLARQAREAGVFAKVKEIRNKIRAHFTPKGNVSRLELLELSHVLDNDVELDPVAKKRVLNTIEHVVAIKNAKALGLKQDQSKIDEIVELFGEVEDETPDIDIEEALDSTDYQKYESRYDSIQASILDKEEDELPSLAKGLFDYEESPYAKSLSKLSNQGLNWLIDMLEYSKDDESILKLYHCYNEQARRELEGKGLYEGDPTNPFVVVGTKLMPLEDYKPGQKEEEFGDNIEMSPDGSMLKYGEEWYTFKLGYDESGEVFDVTLTTTDDVEYRFIPSDEEFASIVAAIQTHKVLESINPTIVNREDINTLVDDIKENLEDNPLEDILQQLSNINSIIHLLDGEIEKYYTSKDEVSLNSALDKMRECIESRNSIIDHLAKFETTDAYKLPLPNLKYEPLIKLNYDATADAREAALKHSTSVGGENSERKVRDIKFTDEQQARIDEFENQIIDLLEALDNNPGLAETIKAMLEGVDIQELNLSDLVNVGLITQEERELLNEIPKGKVEIDNSLGSIVDLDISGLTREDNKGKFLNTHDAKVSKEKRAALEDWLDTVNVEDYQLEFKDATTSVNPLSWKIDNYAFYETVADKNPLDIELSVTVVDKDGKPVTHKGITLEGFPFGKELRVVNDSKDKRKYKENVAKYSELRSAKLKIAKELVKGNKVLSSFKVGNSTLRTDKIDKKNVFEVFGDNLMFGHNLYIRGGSSNDFNWLSEGEGFEALSLSETSNGGFTYVAVKGENGKPYPVRLNYSKVTEPKAQLLFYTYWKMATSSIDEFSLDHIVDSYFYEKLPTHLSGLKDSYSGMKATDLISMLALTGSMTAGKNSHIEYGGGLLIANDFTLTTDELKNAVKDNLYRQYEEAFVAQVMKAYAPVYQKFINKSVGESGLHQGLPLVIDSITFGPETSYNDIIVHEEIGVLSTNAAPIGSSLFEKGFIEPYGARYTSTSVDPTPVDLPEIDITTDPRALTIPDLQAKIKGLESSINNKLGDAATVKVREEIKTLQEVLKQKQDEVAKTKEAKPKKEKKAKKEKPVIQTPPKIVDDSFIGDDVDTENYDGDGDNIENPFLSSISKPLSKADVSRMIDDNIIREDCK